MDISDATLGKEHYEQAPELNELSQEIYILAVNHNAPSRLVRRFAIRWLTSFMFDDAEYGQLYMAFELRRQSTTTARQR